MPNSSIFRIMEEDENNAAFRQSMGQAFRKSPDEAAKLKTVAEQLGTSSSFVENDPAYYQQQAKTKSFNYDDFIKRAPGLVQWASVPSNAELASDDMENLATIETEMTAKTRAVRAEQERVRSANEAAIRKAIESDWTLTKLESLGLPVETMMGAQQFYQSSGSVLTKGVTSIAKIPANIHSVGSNLFIGSAEDMGMPGVAKAIRGVSDYLAWLLPGVKVGGAGAEWVDDKIADPQIRETQSTFVRDPVTGESFINFGAYDPTTLGGVEKASQVILGEMPALVAQAYLAVQTGGATVAAPAIDKISKLARIAGYVQKTATSPLVWSEVSRTVSGQFDSGVELLMNQKGMSREDAEQEVAPGAALAGIFSFMAGAPLEAKFLEGIKHKLLASKIDGPLWKRFFTFTKDVAFDASKEGLQEVANGLGEDFAEKLTYNKEKTTKEIISNMFENAMGGLLVGGHVSAGTQTIGNMDAVHQAALDSKLRERSKETFIDAVRNMVEEGSKPSIPVDQFTRYYQSKGIDPAEKAKELNVQNYEEAVASGSDVEIPAEQFAAKIAGTEDYAGLREDIRMSPDDITIRESRETVEVDAAAVSEEADIAQAKAALEALPSPEIEAFVENRKQQMISAGLAPSVAQEVANLHGRFFGTLAASEGLTVEEMDAMFPLDIASYRATGKKSAVDLVMEHLANVGEGVKTLYQSLAGRASRPKMEGEVANADRIGSQSVGGTETGAGIAPGLSVQSQNQGTGSGAGGALREARGKRTVAAFGDPESVKPSTAQFNPGKATPSEMVALATSTLEDAKAQPLIVPIDGKTQDGYEFSSSRNYVHVRGPNGETMTVTLHPQRGVMAIDAVLVPEGERGKGLSKKLYRRAAQVIGNTYPEIRWAVGNLVSKEVIAMRKSYPGTVSEGNDYATPISSLIQGYSKKEANTFYQESRTLDNAVDNLSDKRGFFQILGQKFHIGLLEGRDLSTMLHESGHFFLEVMGRLAERDGASERIQKMQADTMKWLGVESRSQIETKHHEKFARGFEVYLFEGKAPSEGTRSMFERFKTWMLLVYKKASALGVKLNKDVRSVFDRMIASDEEIEANRAAFAPLFTTAADMQRSPEEFQIYQKALQARFNAGKERLTVRVLEDLKKQEKAAYKTELETVKSEVGRVIDARPEYEAMRRLKDPESDVKLDRQSLETQFGDVADRIPTVETGGMDADTAASVLGFDSGSALVEALRKLPNRDRLVSNMAKGIMTAKYGDKALDGTLAEEAINALHNERSSEVIEMELRELNRIKSLVDKVARVRDRADKAAMREADAKLPSQQAIRAKAASMVEGMRIMDLNPHKYWLAAQQAAKESDKAFRARDYETAIKAKERERLDHFLYLEGRKAQEEAAKIYRHVRTLEGANATKKMAKAGSEYVDQRDALLEQYEFRSVANKDIDKRKTFIEWKEDQEAKGYTVAIDPEIMAAAQRVNYRALNIGQLRAVRDALENIKTLAYHELEMDIEGKKVEKETAIQEMIESARKNMGVKPVPISGTELRRGEKITKWVDGKVAMVTKLERLIDWLDGGDINGPWRRYIFARMANAEIQEFDLNQLVTKKFIDAFERMDPKHRLSMADTVPIRLPGMDRDLNRRQILSILLNFGNPENRKKLLEGYGWTSVETQNMIGEAFTYLTEADLDFVNTTWATLDSLWPAISDLERRMSGNIPTRVEASPFNLTLRNGKTVAMAGGYFPIRYDPSRSSQGAKQIGGNLNELTNSGFTRPEVSHGFTKARTEFSAPMLLDFENTLTRHIAQVIKYVTHQEAASDIYSLLKSPEIMGVLNETVGEAHQRQFLPWLKSIVNERNGSGAEGLEEFSKGVMDLRSNLVMATLAFRLGSVLVQATDIVRATDRVKRRYLMSAIASFTLAQRAGHNELVDEVRAKSGEMRHRPQTFDRDMRTLLQRGFGGEPMKQRVARFGMHGLSMADAMTSTVVWVGAYRQALAQNPDEANAIAEADRTVRLLLQAGSAKDMTALQKGGTLEKLLTMYSGDMFASFGILQDATHNVKGVKDVPKWAARIAWGIILPTILADVIKLRWPDDDDDEETVAEWIGMKSALAIPNTVPILRDIVSALDFGGDYKPSPLGDVINKVLKASRTFMDMAKEDGEKELDDLVFEGADASGTLFGIPGTSPILGTSKFLYKVYKGEEDPETALDWARGIIYGRGKKK